MLQRSSSCFLYFFLKETAGVKGAWLDDVEDELGADVVKSCFLVRPTSTDLLFSFEAFTGVAATGVAAATSGVAAGAAVLELD